MTKTILLGASILAIMAAFPALAADVKADANAEATTGAKIERSLEQTGDKISESAKEAGHKIDAATKDAGAAVKEKYSEMKAYFTDDDDVKAVSSVNITKQLTAEDVIGATVLNPKGESIGKVSDILVDKEGDAERVIINDGGVLGLGKLVAFDYNVVKGVNADQEVVVKLTEESIKQAAEYDNAKVPAGFFSVNKIIGSKVVDAEGKAVAKVDSVAFDDDDADYLIVSFNKILGVGGERAALDFDALEMTDNQGKYTFKLNTQQTAQFENHKGAAQAN